MGDREVLRGIPQTEGTSPGAVSIRVTRDKNFNPETPLSWTGLVEALLQTPERQVWEEMEIRLWQGFLYD